MSHKLRLKLLGEGANLTLAITLEMVANFEAVDLQARGLKAGPHWRQIRRRGTAKFAACGNCCAANKAHWRRNFEAAK